MMKPFSLLSYVIIYSPATIVYGFVFYGIFSRNEPFEWWMLILIPFYFVLNTSLVAMIGHLVIAISFIWKMFRGEG